MAIRKVYYDGKCIMTVDMDYVKEDGMREQLNDIFGMFQERAYKEFNVESRYEAESRKVWDGNENLCALKDQIEQKLEQEIEADSFEKCLEKVDRLFEIMKEKLNDDEFVLFKKLRNEEITCFNNLEQEFFAGEGCFDYVWIDENGKKDWRF